MRVTVSTAVSLDGYIDDRSPRRLVLSGPEDWAEVHRLRASCDAVLVGAETLRRDDPSLRIKDPVLRSGRERAGKPADIMRVTVTRSGMLPSTLKFFAPDGARRVVFTDTDTQIDLPAEVIRLTELSARTITSALDSMGVKRLLVEGGSRTNTMFFAEDAVDELRLAVAPFFVGDPSAPRLVAGGRYPFSENRRAFPAKAYLAGDMAVSHYILHPLPDEADRAMLKEAVETSRLSVPCPTCYRVGCVVVTADGRKFTGYTHETAPSNHAEEEAVLKALSAGASLKGAALYTSLEPCSARASKPESCCDIILRHGVRKVVYALAEPLCLAECRSTGILRRAGVEVLQADDFSDEVRTINAHVISSRSRQ